MQRQQENWEKMFANYISGKVPRARHPGMWSQVGLRKHHYEQR